MSSASGEGRVPSLLPPAPEIFNNCERKVFSLPVVEGGIDFTARGYTTLLKGTWEGVVKGFFQTSGHFMFLIK